MLIACSMLENEILHCLREDDIDIEVVWMDRNLHERPERLRTELQREIDRRQDARYVLLAFCMCGNGTLGLSSGNATLVIPRYDDCIRMYLALDPGKCLSMRNDSLYYTKGWIDGDSFLTKQLDKYYERYGAKKTQRIIELMYGQYTGVTLIDTGAYDVAECMDDARRAACMIGAGFNVCGGSTRTIRKLLRREWDEEFCVIPPGRSVSPDDFMTIRLFQEDA